MTIQCSVVMEGKRCLEVFGSNEPVYPEARFICKNHPRSEQVKAADRQYDPVADNKDAEERFQDGQFDREVGRTSSEPMFDGEGRAIPGAAKVSAKKVN